MNAILQVEKITKRFKGLTAVKEVSFTMQEGQIAGLIGPNGAGKTTLFSCISGFHNVTEGRVLFQGKDISNLASDFISRLGIARTFQIVKPFRDMTVLDNVMVGAFAVTNNVKEALRQAEGICEFGGLGNRLNDLTQNLTLADKKRLEILRALACKPKLLMLDEVAAGLTPNERTDAVELIKKINMNLKISVLMIEHVMEVIMPLCSNIVVLDYGIKIAEGPPGVVVHDEKVIKAYLGERYYAKVIKNKCGV